MITDKSVKELEGSRAALTVTIDGAAIEEEYAKRLQKYAKELTIPGFRKGKTPASVIERKFGDAIREEAVYEMIDKSLQEAVKELPEEERPLPFESPLLKEDDLEKPFRKDSPITYTVEYDVTPKVELPSAYTGLEVSTPVFEVTDKDIDARIEELRDRMAVVRKKDGEVKSGDIVTVSYAEVDKDGNVTGEKREDFSFTVGTGYNFFKIDDDVIGMKAGDRKTVEKTYKEEDHVPGYEGKTILLAIELKEAKEKILPDVDDEFAEDVKEEYKSVADLRAGIKAEFEKTLEEVQKNIKSETLISKICSEVEITVPESMIRSQLDSRYRNMARQSGISTNQFDMFLKQQGIDKDAFLASYRDEELRTLKAQFVLDKIAKTEDFPVDEEEVTKRAEESLKNVPESERDSYLSIIRDDLRFEKVIPFLLEKNTFHEGKKYSYYDYMSGAFQADQEAEGAKEEGQAN